MTSPIWRTEAQTERLRELTGEDPTLRDAPLRRDVRSLGTLLGNVIREQAGDELFGAVETLRQLAIQHRGETLEGDSASIPDVHELIDRAERIVEGMRIAEAYRLTKAFSIYFELTNLAETAHRKRRRRAAQLHIGQPPQPGTLRGTLQRLREAGVERTRVLEYLRRIEVVPVFTAHPTEVSRRTVLFKRRRIAEALERLDQLPLTDAEATAQEIAITAEITALWQTDEVRRKRPSVRDEIQMGLDYYPQVLVGTVPGLYTEMAAALGFTYEEESFARELPRVVRFGSWIGGDRDGNPYVTPEVTRSALQLARETILDEYVRTLEALVERLSPSTLQVGVSPELQRALDRYTETMASLDPHPERRSSTEVYRRFLGYVGWRLRSARDDPARPGAYPDAQAFAEDLRRVRESLSANRGERLARLLLDPLLRQVETLDFTCTHWTSGSMRGCTSVPARSCSAATPRTLCLRHPLKIPRSCSKPCVWWPN